VLPAAGFVRSRDRAPHAAVPLKLKKLLLRERAAVLHDEMAVEQDRFDFGQRGVNGRGSGSPASLDHADFGTGENTAACVRKKIRRGRKSASKMATNFTRRGIEPSARARRPCSLVRSVRCT